MFIHFEICAFANVIKTIELCVIKMQIFYIYIPYKNPNLNITWYIILTAV